jgi:hypothetical protein
MFETQLLEPTMSEKPDYPNSVLTAPFGAAT